MTSLSNPLKNYALVWACKPVLRVIYEDFYDRLASECQPELTIELGGGIGNLKPRLNRVITTDI